MTKRTLDSFFTPPSKKVKVEERVQNPPIALHNTTETTNAISPPTTDLSPAQLSSHSSYPWPLPCLPPSLTESISALATARGKPITNQPHLDLLYFQPFLPSPSAHSLFNFLRSHLFFYRVSYPIKRFGVETTINTPRYTTVFGVDATSTFQDGKLFSTSSISSSTSSPIQPIPAQKYKCNPRPIPPCLSLLKHVTEAATDTSYNICLVNYYASGADSISYHSDDEHFLEREPAIASFSLGAQRDFLMRHKPSSKDKDAKDNVYPGTSTLKLPLGSGDMVLMRGTTQPNWLHSIPKRKGAEADKGRINITLRKAMIPAGTENYYRYNVGTGGVYKWDEKKREMILWEKPVV